MAISQTFAFADNSTLVNFKAWASLISNAFSTFGWVQSSDTGQANLGTIAASPAAGAFVYQIWTANDTLASSNPIFVKIEFGTGTSVTLPSIAVTVGSGSNGAGVLTNAGTRQIIGGGTSSGGTATTFECDFSGSASRIAFCMWRAWTFPSFFSVERSHDSSGNETSSYVTMLASGNGIATSHCNQQTILPSANGGPLFVENFGLTLQTGNTTASFANSVAVAPFFPFVGKLDNPCLGAVCIKDGDFADGAQFGVSLFGTTHNYLVIKSALGSWGNQTTNGVAMRYE